MTMDYSPWSEREIWPFLRVTVSPKPERPRPPKSMCMHGTSTHTCVNFLSQFRSIKFFDDHGLYIYPSIEGSVLLTKTKTTNWGHKGQLHKLSLVLQQLEMLYNK